MTVAELRAKIADLPDEMPVVTADVHPIQDNPGEGEVDWYGGLENGRYSGVWNVSVEKGQAVIR